RLTREFGRRAGSIEQQVKARQIFVKGCAARAKAITDLETGFRVLGADVRHFRVALELATSVDMDATEISRFQSRLGTGLHSQGQLREARELFEAALKSDVKNLGEMDPSVAADRSNLALVLTDLGDQTTAKHLLEQALDSEVKSLGEAHSAVAADRSNL